MGGENSVNEVAINMDVGIVGEELDYEANDNIEHDEDTAEKMETNQHERIVKEVSTSDSEGVNNSALTERTNDHENTKDSKPIRDLDSKIKTPTEAGDVKSDQDQKKSENDKKDVKDQQETSSNVRSVC